MDKQTQTNERTSKAQAAVEFALVLPVLLLLMFGIIEFGRMLVIYITVTSSSREGARYGSAVGATASGLPRNVDCTGMANAAKNVGILAGITNDDINISYDFGPGRACELEPDDREPISPSCNCPIPGTGPSGLKLGDRVIVDVLIHYTPIVPIDFITEGFDIHSQTSRTIIGNVNVGDQIIPPAPPPPSCNIGFHANELSEPEGTDVGNYKAYTITAYLDGSGCPSITVPLSYTGSANQGSGPNDDYQAPTPNITFPRGAHSASFDILINEDNTYEPDETVVVTLGTPSYGTLKPPYQLTLTISNDELLPNVSFDVSDWLVTEDAGDVPVKVKLSLPSAFTVSANFHAADVTTMPGDYTIPVPDPVVFLPGEMEKYILVHVVDDTMDEDDEESMILQLDSAVNATIATPNPFTLTIQDNDLPPLVYFEYESQSVTESRGDFTIRVMLSSQSTKLITVPYTFSGTATNGQDYTLQSANPIEIAAGQTSVTINMHVNEDTDNAEGIETIVVNLGTPTNATLGIPNVHTVNITLISVSFVIPSQALLESAGAVTVELRLSSAWPDDVTIPFVVSGTATGGVDFTISASPVVIPSGSVSRLITINLLNDDLYENPEVITITMGNPINASPGEYTVHNVTIMNDDQAPTVNFTLSSQNVPENDGTLKTITAHLSKASVMDVSVPFSLGGTTTHGVDYSISTSPLVIPAGQTDADITFNVIDDFISEGNETIVVTMLTPVNAIRGTEFVHTATIIENDFPTCSVYDTVYEFDSTHTKFTWRLYNNGVNLEVARVRVQFESSGGKLEVVQFGPTLWTGKDGSITNVTPPWVAGADPSFPGFGNYKYMILNFSAGKYINRINFIEVSFVDSICPPYTRANVQ